MAHHPGFEKKHRSEDIPGKCSSACAFNKKLDIDSPITIHAVSPILQRSVSFDTATSTTSQSSLDTELVKQGNKQNVSRNKPQINNQKAKQKVPLKKAGKGTLVGINAEKRNSSSSDARPTTSRISQSRTSSTPTSSILSKSENEQLMAGGRPSRNENLCKSPATKVVKTQPLSTPLTAVKCTPEGVYTPTTLEELEVIFRTPKEAHNITRSSTKTSTPVMPRKECDERKHIRFGTPQESKPIGDAQNPPTPKSLVPTTKPDSPDNIKLHFKYRRQYFPNNADDTLNITQEASAAVASPSDSSLSVSSAEEFELIYRYKVKSREPRLQKKVHFIKYIPVPIPVPMYVPKLLLNKADPREWEEAQEVYLADRVQNRRKSISDTSIEEEKAQVIPGTPNKSVKCVPIKFRGFKKSKNKGFDTSTNGTESVAESNISFNALGFKFNGQSQNMPKRMDPRFDLDKAEKLIKVNACENPNYNATLYVAIPNNPNYGLCHAMTELSVSAMLNFFHPYRDVQCLWINDMQNKLVELLKDHTLKPKFTRLVYLRKFEAIIVLSQDASSLLRHKDTCFLHSIAAALKIPTHKLLVLVRSGKGPPFRPITA